MPLGRPRLSDEEREKRKQLDKEKMRAYYQANKARWAYIPKDSVSDDNLLGYVRSYISQLPEDKKREAINIIMSA